MKEIIMAIGLPFSGKSSLAEKYEKRGWQLIKRDELLEQIINSQEFKDQVEAKMSDNLSFEQVFALKNEIAIELLNQQLKNLIQKSENDNFFYDGTNLQKKSRAGILALGKKGFKVKGIFLDLPFAEIIKRAKRAYDKEERKEDFNEKAFAALTRMKDMLEPPQKSEGFSELEIIHEASSEPKAEIKNK